MSNYAAIIAKIDRVEPINGADKIQIAYVLGEPVVVSKDWPVGKIGVFFAPDTQLSEEFCHHNNLFRDAEKNFDKEKKGFFENNRKVRAQPFLGVKSCGFFADVDCLNWTGNLDKLSVGMKFEDLNGKHICHKYISEKTRQAMGNSNTKQAKKTFAPLFKEHVDTDQFKYNINSIPKGCLISIQAKQHGCFPPTQRIKLWGGQIKKIGEIVTGDVVIGLDSNNKPTPATVTNVFDNGCTDEWVRLTYTRGGIKGNCTGKIICTKNHQILTGRGYLDAKDAIAGDVVYSAKTTKVPSNQMIGTFLGMLLGDGYMSEQNNMQFCHKLDHLDYLNYKLSIFTEFGDRTKRTTNKISGYGSKTVFNLLPVITTMTQLFSKNQVKGIGKVLTDDLVDLATVETLAFLYMDDGNLQHTEVQQDRAGIAICGIRDEDVHIIIKIFNKFDIYPVHYKRDYNRLRFNTKDAYKLFELIKNIVPVCMQYKLPVELRTGVEPRWDFGKVEDGVVMIPQTIISNTIEVMQPTKKVDIETTTHNYVAGEIFVHNSSFRVANTKTVVELPKWKQFVNKIYPVFPEFEWQQIAGTRRVVLKTDETEKEGFHGSEAYRFEVLEALKPHLSKGMTMYGEIVGFVNGKPIMGVHDITKLKDPEFTKKYGKTCTYTYGCNEAQYKFFVYRITLTTEDGLTIDFTQEQLLEFCKNRGIPHTHDIVEPFVYDGNTEKLSDLVERLTEREDVLTEDYIDPRHVSEGVIVRCDYHGMTPKFYKSKSKAFLIMEGIYREQNVDVEDAS